MSSLAGLELAMFCNRIIVITLPRVYKHTFTTLQVIPHGAAVADGGQWREGDDGEGRRSRRGYRRLTSGAKLVNK